MYEYMKKKILLRELVLSYCLARYINNPISFAILFSTVLIWSFYEMHSSKITSENFVNLFYSIVYCRLLIQV